MEKLDVSVIEAVITGDVFNSACSGDNHSAICDVKHTLRESQQFHIKLREIVQSFMEDPGPPGEIYIEIFAAGFFAAREYFAIKRLEAAVLNTVEPGDRG